MTELQNSAFKMKMSSVPFVGDILPEAGAMVISEHDGHIYYADKYGWHKADGEYSLISLFVDFNGVDQVNFKFQMPSTSTLTIHDGDGTVTDVPGEDTTTVSHVTNYSEPGYYVFDVFGDIFDLVFMGIANMDMVKGSINGWESLPNLVDINTINAINIYGDLDGLMKRGNMTDVNMNSCALVTGSMEAWQGNTVNAFGVFDMVLLTGDISGLADVLSGFIGFLNNPLIRFDHVTTWTATDVFSAGDCKWTSASVDNCLISLANGTTTGQIISIGGNNQRRTSRSDAAVTQLEAAGCTITVNE